jgi:hypothetical protein
MTPLILAAAISLIAASDVPQTPSSTSTSPAPVTKTDKSNRDDPDRVICRTEQVTGSRFNKNVCLTKAQWDEKAAEAEKLEQRIHERAAFGAPSGGAFSGN